MTPTALHLLTAEKVRLAQTNTPDGLALRTKIQNARVIFCDASMIRQPEFLSLRALAPNAKLVASINAHGLYAQGKDNPFYNEFRNTILNSSEHIFWKDENGNYIVGPDAYSPINLTGDKSLGSEFIPSLKTAEILVDTLNQFFKWGNSTWDGVYLDDAWFKGLPPRYVEFITKYGIHHLSAWRGYIQHFVNCCKLLGWDIWLNTASWEGFPNSHNCCEAGSLVSLTTLKAASKKATAVKPWVAFGYTGFLGIEGQLLAGEVIE